MKKRVTGNIKEGEKIRLEELAENLNINVDRLRGYIEEWRKKNYIKTIKDKIIEVYPGKIIEEYGTLPELVLINTLIKEGEVELNSLKDLTGLKEDDLKAAISLVLKTKIAGIKKVDGKRMIKIENLEKAKEFAKKREDIIREISEKRMIQIRSDEDLDETMRELLKRPGIFVKRERKTEYVVFNYSPKKILEQLGKNEIKDLTRDLIISGEWKRKKLKEYDIEVSPYTLYSGKKHPLRELIEEIREIFFEMGFEEVSGPLIETAFVNFDMLFQPQDHPARDMQDTFYLDSPYEKANIPFPDIVDIVKSVHEDGGGTGSKGWGYRWDVEEAMKLVLRTHTTAVTIRNLYLYRDRDTLKLFSIGRVFRNETIDYKHLADFMQVDGILMHEKASLRLLMGILEDFFKRLGAEKIKFWPTYFPFTEPSIQPIIYSEKIGEWIELGGAGIFRPEITEPLGIKKPVLAWGLGLERIVMIKYGIDDIREIYFNRLSWLRKRVV